MNPHFSSDTSMPQVTLIIPVYNEQENLPYLMDQISNALLAQPRSWKVLFIDDGSSDDGLAILKSMAEKNTAINYIAFENNCGQSAALAAGFAYANSEILVTIDSDLQNDPTDIPAMLDLYDQGYDMVIGWRIKRNDKLIKRLASRFANALRNFISNEAIHDTGCSLKVLRASMAKKLPMFTGMHRFLPTLMKLQGASVLEVPVKHHLRAHGQSKYAVWDRAFPALYDLFAVRWMQKRTFRYTIRERR